MESSYLVFDLETVGLNFDTFDDAQQEYLLRRAETDEDRTKIIGEMALSPMTGRIVTIGMLHMIREGDGWGRKEVVYQVDPLMSDTDDVRKEDLASGAVCYYSSEVVMITNFWRLLESHRGIHLVSFNGRGFDAPWVMLRSAVLGIRPTRNLMEGTKFNYRGHTDLLDELTFYARSFSGATRTFNFDFYAKAFGVTSPKSEGIHGGMVPHLFADGKIEVIAEYCLRDVRSTWDLYLKWHEMFGH